MGEAIINFIMLFVKDKTGRTDVGQLMQDDYEELIKYIDAITRSNNEK